MAWSDKAGKYTHFKIIDIIPFALYLVAVLVLAGVLSLSLYGVPLSDEVSVQLSQYQLQFSFAFLLAVLGFGINVATNVSSIMGTSAKWLSVGAISVLIFVEFFPNLMSQVLSFQFAGSVVAGILVAKYLALSGLDPQVEQEYGE